MTEKEINEITSRYQAGNATEEDKAFLESWYLHHNMADQFEIADNDRISDVDLAWNEIQTKTAKPAKTWLLPRIAAAAAILVILSFGLYFYSYKASGPGVPPAKTDIVSNIGPGGNKAFLTLSNGKKISLTDVPEGEIAEQAGIRIKKSGDGQIIYEVINTDHQEGNQFNTIETPRGGQYQVKLPDGSRVWLNAASSLKYPTNFTGSERKVELKGEGYFEIAHNKSMPFKVVSNNQVVEVLGTHFNLNAYTDENPVTTLLEGSVKVVTSKDIAKVIKPGEQAELSANGTLKVSDVDTDLSVAWKDGKFIFRNEPVESAMRKIARWYDVEVVYPDGVPQRRVWANVSKFQNVADILELIELSKVAHFKVVPGDASGKGRRIIVMK
ncbi:MAG TPA: FecR domain-containing protein [Sphingobacteriaceae bacterium]